MRFTEPTRATRRYLREYIATHMKLDREVRADKAKARADRKAAREAKRAGKAA